MPVRLIVRLSLVVVALLGLTVSTASAEIIFLTSGRTLSVKSHREDGTSMVFTLRSGGEVTCEKSLIDRIEPDEVPHPDPQAAEAAAAETQAPVDAASILGTTPYGEIISALSQAHGVDPLLVRALIQVESNYRPKARSAKGAMGLMQIMPSTARQYQVRNPYDPTANIEAGIKKLKSLLDYLPTDLALAAYNAGEGAVQKFNGIPPYRETQTYVRKILSLIGGK